MSQRILGFAGSKQSGKTSSVNFLVGLELSSLGIVDSFHLNEQGELIVPTQVGNDIVEGVWDSAQTELSWEGLVFLDQNVYPFIKTYNFADTLKRICVEVFGLDKEKIYGGGAEKDELTDIKWENLPHYEEICNVYRCKDEKPPARLMTYREFMQELGTGIFRQIKPNCWINHTLNMVKKEDTELAVIGDVRFADEAQAILDAGGRVIYLQRNSDNTDSHKSENDLQNFKNFSAVIDNRNKTIKEKNDEIYQILRAWGYLSFELKDVGEEYSAQKVNA